MTLTNGSKVLKFDADEKFEPTLHFTGADLFSRLHTNELKPRKETIITIDHKQRGIEQEAYRKRLKSIALMANTFSFRIELA